MYLNKCTKCGAEFETKNPKRVICPDCLYPDRNPIPLKSYSEAINQPQEQPEGQETNQQNNFQPEGRRPFNPENRGNYQGDGNFRRPQQHYNQQGDGGFRRPYQNNDGGYRRPNNHGGYNQHGGYPQQGGYNQQGGFRRPPQQGGYNNQGGFRRPPQQGGYNNQGGFRRPQGDRRPAAKSLLISREQVAQIEELYRNMLPLPNPDAHEVIGKEIDLEPNKVFFGMNLIRQKMRLPKLPYPKRKLALTPDQLMAIENLYSPLLPLPPIGCHKIIAKQLKMDEWRVHVGIGIIRKQMNLPRWNAEREDAPAEFKVQKEAEQPASE